MLPNRYNFHEAEPRLAQQWADADLYAFEPTHEGVIYSIDTPPPTVSGELHLGHCYSFTQTDVLARFHRMRGEHVLYPMGFDDNGLPTERFVEKTIKRRATEMDRSEFLAHCLDLISQTEDHFEMLWRRLSLSVDWHYRYSTISPLAQRIAQRSFLQLLREGKAYTQQVPTLWCPDCQTAIAQAELEDQTIPTLFSTFTFTLPDGQQLPIATTRPELLPACVAIFVHPEDSRYVPLIGLSATIESNAFSSRPLLEVPILADEHVDPAKGSGAVMCCTFGDSMDVHWWRTHQLPLLSAIGRDGRMTELAGPIAGLSAIEARKRILQQLTIDGKILHQETIEHTVGVHERCGTPIEYLRTKQWFISVLDQKERFIETGRKVQWNPEYMRIRYEHWVENLQWDWCISRQRFLGVPLPVWTCRSCGKLLQAAPEQLPVDPRTTSPLPPCSCGSTDAEPEMDVMDTWATSSCSPFIIEQLVADSGRKTLQFPMNLRPQAHDIIRTWAFYTIVKAEYHLHDIPWREIVISGHGLSPQRGKLSKSKGNSTVDPLALIEQESADALRYWATSVSTGQDTPFNPETLANGRRLITKLWNASRFAERHLQDLDSAMLRTLPATLLPTDRWLLVSLEKTIVLATGGLERGDYAAVRTAIERFFWSDLCDNYLELAKSRLYQKGCSEERFAAQWTLYHGLLNVLKLLAPYLPFITEEIYLHLFQQYEESMSIHISRWPERKYEGAEHIGEDLLCILRHVRRYKADRGLSVGAPLDELCIIAPREDLLLLKAASTDLISATKAQRLTFQVQDDAEIKENPRVQIKIVTHA